MLGRAFRCAMVCAALLSTASVSVADARPSTESSSVIAEELDRNSSSDDLAQRKRKRAADVAVVLLGGIVCIGVVLLAFVLLWGRRTRRIARQRSSKPTTLDGTWYLKPDKQVPSSSADDSENKDKTKD